MKFLPFALALFLCACAETPDGVIVMNEQTIENFFEDSKKSWDPGMQLNLLDNQPVTQAELPPLAPGNARLQGTLVSDGAYVFRGGQTGLANRGGTFTKSVFGMLGPAGDGGNAWFFADFNPQTGEIAQARAYLYGVMTGVCDLRQPVGGKFGTVETGKVNLGIGGYCLFPQMEGSAIQFAILLQGNATASGAYSLRYALDDTGRLSAMPQNPAQDASVFDFGTGQAQVAP